MSETVPERMARRERERKQRIEQREKERKERQKKQDQQIADMMSTVRKPLKSYSDTDLLKELIRRNKLQAAPTSITYAPDAKMQGVVLAVGKDHHAEIFIGGEDLEVLNGLS